jgi:hypothetical protein
MTTDITHYLDRITSEYNDKPLFMAVVAAFVQPFADIAALLDTIPGLFDLDFAVGDQLDKVGRWVGRTRFLTTPLTGIYFAFDTDGVGLDQGIWYETFNPISGLIRLPDEPYRTLLRATIAANNWDGTIPGAYAIWQTLFPLSSGLIFLLQDNGDMTMDQILLGTGLTDPVIAALFSTGALDLKPAGVRVNRILGSVAGEKLFSFDADNDVLGGFDDGAWGLVS